MTTRYPIEQLESDNDDGTTPGDLNALRRNLTQIADIGWSPGNPFCYGYSSDIHVIPIDGEVIDEPRARPVSEDRHATS